MGSQSGNYQDLAASSGHSPSCIIGADAEPGSSSRNEYPSSHSQPLSTEMGMQQYMNRISDDVRFTSEPGTSHSPVYSLEPAVQNTNPTSSLAYAPYTQIYQQPLNGSTYASGGTYHFPPNSALFSMPELKPPRLGSFTSSGLAPLSRSPALPHPSTPITTRDLYAGSTPHLRRPSDILRSPSVSHSVRGVPLSPSSTSGFTSPISNMDGSLGGAPCPPLGATEVSYSLQTSDGQIIKPEIFGKIDKGFFMADNDWTCYRRNYFSLNCSYTLTPTIPNGSMYLVQHSGPGPQVHGFAMSIAAVVDGRDGKSIELVQHTPKRDKGPQEKPARMTLAPRPPASGMYGDSSMGARGGMYDSPGFSQNPNQPAVEATFERIQFKNATANNGKRRAAQQYYHLLVELFADVGNQHPDRWVKIASRMSAPMVVRGRSPGHYQGERRGSNGSAGPGSSTGPGGSSYTSGSSSRTPGDMGMGSSSSMLPGSGYGSYDNRSGGHYRSGLPPLHEPVLPPDEGKALAESPCYLYYPGGLYEGGPEQKYTLPSVGDYTTSKVKQEYGPGPGAGGYGRQCRWDGVDQSRGGYYPTAGLPHELNLSV